MYSLFHLLEGSLGQQMPLYPTECLVRVIVGLLDQPELLPLDGVQSRVHAVVFLQPLQRQDQQLHDMMGALYNTTKT